MYYCEDCDIAHETKICPLCEANKTIEELEKRIKELESEE